MKIIDGKQCNYCNGIGKVCYYINGYGEKDDSPLNVLTENDFDWFISYEIKTCRICNGIGYVTYGIGDYS